MPNEARKFQAPDFARATAARRRLYAGVNLHFCNPLAIAPETCQTVGVPSNPIWWKRQERRSARNHDRVPALLEGGGNSPAVLKQSRNPRQNPAGIPCGMPSPFPEGAQNVCVHRHFVDSCLDAAVADRRPHDGIRTAAALLTPPCCTAPWTYRQGIFLSREIYASVNGRQQIPAAESGFLCYTDRHCERVCLHKP